MRWSRSIFFTIFGVLLLFSSLLVYAKLLLKDLEFYNAKPHLYAPISIVCIFYGFSAFFTARFLKAKRLLMTLVLITFSVIYLFIGFQIAYEARGEFGTTWLPSEVFWELFVREGKGLWVLGSGLFVYSTGLLFLGFKKVPKNP